MRLAICFFGQPRYLDNKKVHECYTNLINRYETDVYVHSWISGKDCEMSVSDWAKKHSIKECADATEKILSLYSPIKYKFDSPFDGRLTTETRQKASVMRFYTENNERNLLSHLKSYSESIRLVQNPQEYDFILMTRFDAYLFDFPNLHTLDTDKFYLTKRYDGGWCDITQLCGSKFAKAFDVYDNFDLITDTLVNLDPTFIAELYKRENYDLSYSRTDLRYIESLSSGIVRSNQDISSIQV